MKSSILNLLSFVLMGAISPVVVQSFPGHANLYQTPNKEGSVRGACPIINTIANHGFINRSGKNVDLFEMVDILAELFGFSVDSLLGTADAAITFGLTFVDEDGVVRLNLDRLHEHSTLEHDGSLFREDAFYGEERSFGINDSLFNALLRINPNSDVITKEELMRHQFNRLVESRRTNPEFDLPFGVGGLAGQAVFILSVGQDPDLASIDKKTLLQFFLLERFPDDYVVPEADTFTFNNDISGVVFLEFFANGEAALAVEVVAPPTVP